MKPEVVYANTQQSTNPPAAPPPTQPVVYADIQQSTNPPAAPPSTQPVVYAEVKISCSECDHCSMVGLCIRQLLPSIQK